MTAQQLADLLSKSSKPITPDVLYKLRGAISRENRLSNPVTFEDVVACLSPELQQAVAKASVQKR